MNRLYNIARTGNIADTTPVENIMAQMPQDQNLWQKTKNFAGSTLGRNLIGGLATAAAVGLTGGNAKDALEYGVIGAGETMNTINRRKQYENQLLQQQQDRADKLAEAQANRDFQMQVADRQIAAEKEAADLAFERRLQELANSQAFEREIANINRQNALEDLAAEREFAREGWENQAQREQAGRDFQAQENERGRIFQRDTGDIEYGRRKSDLADEREYQKELRLDQRAYDKELLQDQRIYDKELLDNERLYNQTLQDQQRAYDRGQIEDQRAYEDAVALAQREFELEKAKSDMDFKQSQANKKYLRDVALQQMKAEDQRELETLKNDYANQSSEKAAQRELAKQRAKYQAEEEKAQRQMEEIRPRLERAINDAKVAVRDGSGLGQIGGRGWTTAQGGRNRSAIMNAQTQMNTAMRSILSSMGVGASEMNSGIEAAAYRYVISPEMTESQILSTIEAFEKDYMNGNLEKNLQGIANDIKLQRKTGGQIPTDEDAWGGI